MKHDDSNLVMRPETEIKTPCTPETTPNELRRIMEIPADVRRSCVDAAYFNNCVVMSRGLRAPWPLNVTPFAKYGLVHFYLFELVLTGWGRKVAFEEFKRLGAEPLKEKQRVLIAESGF